MEPPSTTEAPDILFDEKDMGDAGKRKYGSVLMLALLCSCGSPENAELASVTKELAPILGLAEFAAVFKIPWFISQKRRHKNNPSANVRW